MKTSFVWPDGTVVAIEGGACPFCLKRAVVALTPTLLAKQPDATTHVCHPALGGCNHGFEDCRAKEKGGAA